MPVTIRSLAAACGVSTATVSRALSGRHYVRAAVRRRIQGEAERLGYRRNQLVGTLMSHLRGARSERFRGNLAIVHVPFAPGRPVGPQEQRIITSAIGRARELGFGAELFTLGADARAEAAFARVCSARGMTGVIFVYPGPSLAPHDFPWDDFSSLAIDYARREPLLHTVCHDHFMTLTQALGRLQAAGYRRIGLFIEHFKDERTDFRWSGGFLSYRDRRGGIGRVPVCAAEAMTEAIFLKWYEKHRPDVVVGHGDEAIGWLRRAGAAVPETTAFFSLNWLSRSQPCAGVDPQLELQGQVAAQSLIAQIQRGEVGLPENPRLITVRGKLIEGPTVCL